MKLSLLLLIIPMIALVVAELKFYSIPPSTDLEIPCSKELNLQVLTCPEAGCKTLRIRLCSGMYCTVIYHDFGDVSEINNVEISYECSVMIRQSTNGECPIDFVMQDYTINEEDLDNIHFIDVSLSNLVLFKGYSYYIMIEMITAGGLIDTYIYNKGSTSRWFKYIEEDFISVPELNDMILSITSKSFCDPTIKMIEMREIPFEESVYLSPNEKYIEVLNNTRCTNVFLRVHSVGNWSFGVEFLDENAYALYNNGELYFPIRKMETSYYDEVIDLCHKTKTKIIYMILSNIRYDRPITLLYNMTISESPEIMIYDDIAKLGESVSLLNSSLYENLGINNNILYDEKLEEMEYNITKLIAIQANIMEIIEKEVKRIENNLTLTIDNVTNDLRNFRDYVHNSFSSIDEEILNMLDTIYDIMDNSTSQMNAAIVYLFEEMKIPMIEEIEYNLLENVIIIEEEFEEKLNTSIAMLLNYSFNDEYVYISKAELRNEVLSLLINNTGNESQNSGISNFISIMLAYSITVSSAIFITVVINLVILARYKKSNKIAVEASTSVSPKQIELDSVH